MRRIEKPETGEYAPYAIQYIGLLPDDGRVLDHLRTNVQRTRELVLSLSEEKLVHRYAEGKWTIKEILCSGSSRRFARRRSPCSTGSTTRP